MPARASSFETLGCAKLLRMRSLSMLRSCFFSPPEHAAHDPCTAPVSELILMVRSDAPIWADTKGDRCTRRVSNHEARRPASGDHFAAKFTPISVTTGASFSSAGLSDDTFTPSPESARGVSFSVPKRSVIEQPPGSVRPSAPFLKSVT